MSRGESPKKEPRSLPENKKLKTSEELHIFVDDQSKSFTLKGNIHPLDLDKLPIPNPPKGRQKPMKLMACVGKTQPADEVRTAVRGVGAHPVNLDPDSQPLDYTGPEGLRFDDQGMILPHSILGSLEDFQRYLETKGETELVKRIPKSQRDPPSEAPGRRPSEAVEIPSGYRNIQSNKDLLSGIIRAEPLRPASRTRDQSAYPQHQCQELREVLRDLDAKKPAQPTGDTSAAV